MSTYDLSVSVHRGNARVKTIKKRLNPFDGLSNIPFSVSDNDAFFQQEQIDVIPAPSDEVSNKTNTAPLFDISSSNKAIYNLSLIDPDKLKITQTHPSPTDLIARSSKLITPNYQSEELYYQSDELYIIHLARGSIMNSENIPNYVSILVDDKFSFEKLSKLIDKNRRTLIYSSDVDYNHRHFTVSPIHDAIKNYTHKTYKNQSIVLNGIEYINTVLFIQEYNTFLKNPDNFNKNLSIMHSNLSPDSYLFNNENYNQVLNLYFDEIHYHTTKFFKTPNSEDVKKLLEDANGYNKTVLKGDHKFHILHTLQQGVYWWYDIYLTDNLPKFTGTCVLSYVLNIILFTPIIKHMVRLNIKDDDVAILPLKDIANSNEPVTELLIKFMRFFICIPANLLELKNIGIHNDIVQNLSAQLIIILKRDNKNKKPCTNRTNKRGECYNNEPTERHKDVINMLEYVFSILLKSSDYWIEGELGEKNQPIRIMKQKATKDELILQSCLLLTTTNIKLKRI